jgi:hypothetical protein
LSVLFFQIKLAELSFETILENFQFFIMLP